MTSWRQWPNMGTTTQGKSTSLSRGALEGRRRERKNEMVCVCVSDEYFCMHEGLFACDAASSVKWMVQESESTLTRMFC